MVRCIDCEHCRISPESERDEYVYECGDAYDISPIYNEMEDTPCPGFEPKLLCQIILCDHNQGYTTEVGKKIFYCRSAKSCPWRDDL